MYPHSRKKSEIYCFIEGIYLLDKAASVILWLLWFLINYIQFVCSVSSRLHCAANPALIKKLSQNQPVQLQ